MYLHDCDSPIKLAKGKKLKLKIMITGKNYVLCQNRDRDLDRDRVFNKYFADRRKKTQSRWKQNKSTSHDFLKIFSS